MWVKHDQVHWNSWSTVTVINQATVACEMSIWQNQVTVARNANKRNRSGFQGSQSTRQTQICLVWNSWLVQIPLLQLGDFICRGIECKEHIDTFYVEFNMYIWIAIKTTSVVWFENKMWEIEDFLSQPLASSCLVFSCNFICSFMAIGTLWPSST